MNTIELQYPDGTPSGVYYCGECRGIKRHRPDADQCCVPPTCQDCGKPTPHEFYRKCDACCALTKASAETALFARAEKLSEWAGPVYLGDCGPKDGFFDNLSSLEDWLYDERLPRPSYVWTCHSTPFCQVDYESLIENVSTEAYDDWDTDGISGEAELRAAIEKFNEANADIVTWSPDRTRVLVLPSDGPDLAARLARLADCGVDTCAWSGLPHDELLQRVESYEHVYVFTK